MCLSVCELVGDGPSVMVCGWIYSLLLMGVE